MIFIKITKDWPVLLTWNLSLLLWGCAIADGTLGHDKNMEIKTFEPTLGSQFLFSDRPNRRNPFMPVKRPLKTTALLPDQARRKQALEYFSLDALHFVGHFQKGEVLKALIKQPNGVICFLEVGDYLGKNNGRVLAISENSIRLEELVHESGMWVKHLSTMHLDGIY